MGVKMKNKDKKYRTENGFARRIQGGKSLISFALIV